MARAILLLMLFYGWPAGAAVTTPARLIDGADSIESRIRLPEGLQPGRYDIKCDAWVRRSGRVRSFLCYAPEEPLLPLANAVGFAGRGAMFAPATRDGKAAAVYMPVMVRIEINNSGSKVLAVPNNGVETERYGLFYTAPQRFNEFTWNARQRTFFSHRALLWMKLSIDEHGKLVDYLVTNVSNAPSYMVKRTELAIQRMEFMPGYFEGKPVPMFHVEALTD